MGRISCISTHTGKRFSSPPACILVILIALGLAVPLAAQNPDTDSAAPRSGATFNWGGYVQSQTDINIFPADDFSIDEGVVSGLWLEGDISDALMFYLKASYTYSTTHPSRIYFFNPDMAFAEGSFILGGGSRTEQKADGKASLIRYRLGRFGFSEFTSYVLNHPLDGLQLAFEHPLFSLEAGGGYTGLTFAPKSTITITQNDVDNAAGVREDGYSLAPPKTIETLKIRFPDLLFKQSLIFNAVLQQDLEKLIGDGDGDILHTEYAGIGINGPLIGSFYHNLFFYYNYGHGSSITEPLISAFITGGGLRYYNKTFYFTRIALKALYSSGDVDKESFYGVNEASSSRHFTPVSKSPETGIVFSPEIGNLSMAELNWSMQPFSKTGNRTLERFQTALSAYTFFRNTGGVISEESRINESSAGHYLGTEVDVSFHFRPFSDLGISLAGGVFLPNNYSSDSPLYSDEGNPPVEAAGRVSASFSY